jgi:endonuclease G
VHTTLGIPEPASIDDPQHALLVKSQYVVSFDGNRKNPRWTSWELTSAWLGSASRSLDFSPDPSLPSDIPQASSNDYVKSGYSRGHLCPSADRTDNATDNLATFQFTNAVPQTAQSNTGPWEDLEKTSRALATAGHHLFIVAGSRYETDQTIGNDVAVPTSMFKVVVVMDGEHPLPSDVTAATRVIAVDIPNTTTVHGAYTNYVTSFGKLESETGLRFMSDVSDAMHDALASKIDGQ